MDAVLKITLVIDAVIILTLVADIEWIDAFVIHVFDNDIVCKACSSTWQIGDGCCYCNDINSFEVQHAP